MVCRGYGKLCSQPDEETFTQGETVRSRKILGLRLLMMYELFWRRRWLGKAPPSWWNQMAAITPRGSAAPTAHCRVPFINRQAAVEKYKTHENPRDEDVFELMRTLFGDERVAGIFLMQNGSFKGLTPLRLASFLLLLQQRLLRLLLELLLLRLLLLLRQCQECNSKAFWCILDSR